MILHKIKAERIIIAFLGLALIITLVGTIIQIKDHFSSNETLLTGAASANATGTATITLSSTTAITNNVATIAFGSGYVNATGCGGRCVMDSNGQHNQTGGCCIGFSNVSSGFLLENTGNINISVNYTCSGSCTAATFIGGTAPAFQMKTTANSVALQTGESGSTDSAPSCFGQSYGGWNFTANYTTITAAGDWLCGDNGNYSLDYTNSQDAAVIDINVSIPVDAPTGAQKTATFVFNALSSG